MCVCLCVSVSFSEWLSVFFFSVFKAVCLCLRFEALFGVRSCVAICEGVFQGCLQCVCVFVLRVFLGVLRLFFCFS